MAPMLRAAFCTQCRGLAGCVVSVSLVSSSGGQGQTSMGVSERILTEYITTSSFGEEAQISPGMATG